MNRVRVTCKIALVLVTLSVGPLLVAALIGLCPTNDDLVRRDRIQSVQELSLLIRQSLEGRGPQGIPSAVESFCDSCPEMDSVRIVRFDGHVFFESPGFAEAWKLEPGDASTIDQIRVSISRNQREWAQLEVVFSPLPWLQTAIVRYLGIVLLAIVLNGASFGYFVNRSLSALEPNDAVPRRVRNTLDTIAGGVVVLDGKGRIMMANESFTESLKGRGATIVGSKLSAFPWRFADGEAAPWETATSEQRRCEGSQVFLSNSDGIERCFVVNATPVFDSQDRMAGSLVSFEDITALEEQRKDLMLAMTELARSREEVRQQNVMLQELALRDALTGAYNRRALYERLEAAWSELDQQPKGMIAMMMDIDHFKKLNDKHGHAAGDSVLKDLTHILHRLVDGRGFVARYGGEEFCVFAKDQSLEDGLKLAEEIRNAIEADLRTPYAVTTSIGVASTLHHPESIPKLLELADKALYAAKHNGRNRVTVWTPAIDNLEEANKQRALSIQNLSVIDDHPVSYHAVLSLHSALSFRHADTAIHSQRVAELCINIARGLMPANELYVLEISALLHDIGKIGVSDAILTKPGRLTDEEWKAMEAHGPIGVAIVETAFDCPQLNDVLRYHHCRFDGVNQDPSWPSGKKIPLSARVVAIADAYDAMVSDRCYRPGRSHEEAIAELQRCAGGQFDPDLVQRFVKLQTGWRIDSRFGCGMETDRSAINIGYHIERVIHSFEVRDPVSLKLRLGILKATAIRADQLHIAAIVEELTKDADRKTIADWDSLLPILQDLVEVCSTLQRAYLRYVGAKPIRVDDCPSQAYLREFWNGSETVEDGMCV